MPSTPVLIVALLMMPAIIAVSGGLLLGHRKQMLKMQLEAADPQHVKALLETAQRMEQRIGYLERVLDHEAPGWRTRSETP